MRVESRRIILVAVVLLLLVFLVGVTGCSSDSDNGTSTDDTPVDTNTDAGDVEPEDGAAPVDSGRQVVETQCSLCHTTDRVWAADYSTEEWIGVIDRMKRNGLVVSAEQYAIILDTLTTQ